MYVSTTNVLSTKERLDQVSSAPLYVPAFTSRPRKRKRLIVQDTLGYCNQCSHGSSQAPAPHDPHDMFSLPSLLSISSPERSPPQKCSHRFTPGAAIRAAIGTGLRGILYVGACTGAPWTWKLAACGRACDRRPSSTWQICALCAAGMNLGALARRTAPAGRAGSGPRGGGPGLGGRWRGAWGGACAWAR